MKSFNEQIQSSKPILVDFYAEWCGPCKMMKPILLDVAERMGDAVTILTIDVDKEKELATKHRIQSVPTLIIYKNGKQLWRQSGVISANALTKLLKEYQENNEENFSKPRFIVCGHHHLIRTEPTGRVRCHPNEQADVSGQGIRLY